MSFHRSALAAIGASAFFYVAAETLPIGLLPQISADLHVSEARVGLLMTSYAVVAALSTIPLTAVTMRIPRHLLIAVTVAIFAVSQAAATFAPTFPILAGSRLLCALAHGVFWSVLLPIVARLAPPDQIGRASALTSLGNSLAIVLGVPLGTALGQWLGWRVAIGSMAVGGVICVVLLLTVLPALPPLPRDRAAGVGQQLGNAVRILRDGRVARLCLVTAVLVIGHFAAYTYIAPLVRRDGGLDGAGLSALLLGYGVAGLLTTYLVGRHIDRRPGPLLLILLAAQAASVALLAPVLGLAPTIVATLVWGGAFTAIPAVLGSVPLRIAPHARDAASAVYVVAFQIGIGSGAFVGERLVTAGSLGMLPLLAGVLAVVAGTLVLFSRSVFPTRISADDHHRVAAEAAAVAR
ncbi:putative MFS family arabinose efflux permease [Actinoplanes octamycinicus]|uniref:Putative MFS family arabinose efflux permease n=1 Tax=Actinoplanes octamycinicus TaxID=135948 RepID=A0A7W7M5J2_9ACTN|nr:MFS transporter [Actinoplanes octamycinicus]MBB4737760.1 putative MFS family arabinose efflux permease [Actinoplanes octamycinicus]GIE58060.1 MFS transporter [Actinoplanes octamycinicus]